MINLSVNAIYIIVEKNIFTVRGFKSFVSNNDNLLRQSCCASNYQWFVMEFIAKSTIHVSMHINN